MLLAALRAAGPRTFKPPALSAATVLQACSMPHALGVSRPFTCSYTARALQSLAPQRRAASAGAAWSRRYSAAAPTRQSAAPPPPPPAQHSKSEAGHGATKGAEHGSTAAADSNAELHHDIPHVSFFSSPIGWWRANNARLKVLFKRYGRLTLVTYLGVYVLTLSGLYALVRCGLVAGPDVNAFINGWFVKKAVLGDVEVHVPAAWGDFATAWVLTKTTEPLRLVATLAVVPVIVRRAPHSVLRFLKALPAEGAAGASAAAKDAASRLR